MACRWNCGRRINCRFQVRPLRGQARSHRYSTALKVCVVPVGAGLPAKRPGQAKQTYISRATDPAPVKRAQSPRTPPAPPGH
ncbi:hypothetical protein D0894_04860 [Pseudomonas monteilii]|uniref:Uncharacterized protein n=1 Tax=Pseudomonas monteilii TaxID=76759 RepID=A0A399MDG4_9PSED|nr:hypothetical protein D0894_04860 [Pseudomonas monteilii]